MEKNEIEKLRTQLAIAEAATARARAEVAAHEAAWARLASTAHVLRRGESGAHQSLDEFESGGWHDVAERAPLPPGHDASSPLLAHLFQSWTPERAKRRYLQRWIEQIVSGGSVAHQPNVELTMLQPEIRDGFLSFLVPLLCERKDIRVVVQAKEHLVSISDLRIRIVSTETAEMPAAAVGGGGGGAAAAAGEAGGGAAAAAAAAAREEEGAGAGTNPFAAAAIPSKRNPFAAEVAATAAKPPLPARGWRNRRRSSAW